MSGAGGLSWGVSDKSWGLMMVSDGLYGLYMVNGLGWG